MEHQQRVEDICSYFEQLCSTPYNEEIRAWKENGGKVIGTLYNQVPEEIIHAAGALPVRLRAQQSTGTEGAAGRFTQVNCSLVKHFYDSATKGQFDFIDGLVASNACDHARKLEENWASELKPAYVRLICFPKRQGDELEAKKLAHEYADLRQSLADELGLVSTESDLAASIELFNEIRDLQMRLNNLRANENPPISGRQTLAVFMAGTAMPKERYRNLLSELVTEAEMAPGISDYRARVVVYGGEIDSLDLFEAIESQGALIVGDSLGGFGRRSADMQVGLEGDLIHNLAVAYLQGRPSEPRLHGTRAARWAYLEDVAEAVSADGYIQIHIPICDLWSYERIMFDTEVEKRGLACLDLDTEYIFSTPGQTRTRVQAFVESLTEGGR
ncbi:2-hydroxyacyl-CoA dehydratase family protein [Slackia exigua]|uniref:2-hydroxyacyl-CoA dehydratase subunit D n=1 Tax=Slackia exigua TaxID=84109 RepID=UPI0028D7C40D|nr:2-hydroxyacyl-CoA dehydratase family protein [Slackia exigua]